MPAQFDLQTRRRLPSEDMVSLFVSSVSGADTNAGTSDAPLATLEEALGRVPSLLWGRRARVRLLPGHTETIARPLFVPPIVGAGHLDDVALDGEDSAWDYLRPQVLIDCAPVAVEDVNGVISAEATTGLVTVTDASKNWAPNVHVGRTIYNPANPAESAIIWANTATELFTTAAFFSDGGLRIATRGATLNVGDAGLFVTAGVMMTGNTAAMGIVGVNIRANPAAGPALDHGSPGALSLLLCEISGGFQCRGRANTVTVDSCYLTGGSFAPNAGSIAVRQSLLNGMTAAFHSVNGQYDLFSCRVQGCGPMGHGGSSTPHGGFRIDNTWIASGTGHGVKYGGGARSRIQATRIDSCAGDAVNADGVGNLDMSSVVGTGSTGSGAKIKGSTVIGAGNTVRGNLVTGANNGEVVLNATGYTWSQAPQVDAATFSRFATA